MRRGGDGGGVGCWRERLYRGGAGEALLGQDQRHDQTVEAQSLGEDENENHAYEDLVLLSDGADAGITYNADSHAGSQATETAAQAGGQVGVADETGVFGGAIDGGGSD